MVPLPGESDKKRELGETLKEEPFDRWFWALFLFFVFIFLGSLIGYVWLHLIFKEGASIYPKTEAAQRRVLGEIQKAEDLLASSGGLSSDASSNNQLPRSVAVPDNSSKLEKLVALRTSLDVIEDEIRDIPWIDPDALVFQNLKRSIESRESSFSEEQIRREFEGLAREVQKGGDIYFWNIGSWRWVEYFFWALFGTLIYLLGTLASNQRKKNKEPFSKYVSWYIVNLFRSPFIVLILLMGLSSIEIQVIGVKFTLNSAPIELMIFLSATLSVFSRTAKEQLVILVEKVFPEAWDRSEGHISIQPNRIDVPYGGRYQFKTEQQIDTTWSIEKSEFEGSHGTIDPRHGLYVAPDSKEARQIHHVIIKAVADRYPKHFDTALITLTNGKSSTQVDREN